LRTQETASLDETLRAIMRLQSEIGAALKALTPAPGTGRHA
jgi:hypothetical protein